MNDWIGNASMRNCNMRTSEAEPNDYYATEPRAVELLLDQEQFAADIWEPACGQGHISKVLELHGYHVLSTDLIDRGYGVGGMNFLSIDSTITHWEGDIITNPPYRYAKEFVEKALELVKEGSKVAMFLKLTFLEGKARSSLFKSAPPETVYVSSARLQCAKNGNFPSASMVAYAWYIWRKGNTSAPIIKWIN